MPKHYLIKYHQILVNNLTHWNRYSIQQHQKSDVLFRNQLRSSLLQVLMLELQSNCPRIYLSKNSENFQSMLPSMSWNPWSSTIRSNHWMSYAFGIRKYSTSNIYFFKTLECGTFSNSHVITNEINWCSIC